MILVCLHCTIAVSHVHWNIKSQNLSLKVPEFSGSHCIITVYTSDEYIMSKSLFKLKSNKIFVHDNIFVRAKWP